MASNPTKLGELPEDEELQIETTYDSLEAFVCGDPEWWMDPDED